MATNNSAIQWIPKQSTKVQFSTKLCKSGVTLYGPKSLKPLHEAAFSCTQDNNGVYGFINRQPSSAPIKIVPLGAMQAGEELTSVSMLSYGHAAIFIFDRGRVVIYDENSLQKVKEQHFESIGNIVYLPSLQQLA